MNFKRNKAKINCYPRIATFLNWLLISPSFENSLVSYSFNLSLSPFFNQEKNFVSFFLLWASADLGSALKTTQIDFKNYFPTVTFDYLWALVKKKVGTYIQYV